MPLSKITNPFLDPSGAARSNVYSPSANTIGIVTSGIDRVRVNSAGNLGVGTTSPQATIHSTKAGAEVARFTNSNSNGGDWEFKIGGGGFEDRKFMITDKFSGADNVRVNIDSAGRVTMPYQPYLHATVAGGTTAINFGTTHATVTVPFNSIFSNTGNHFNTSTSTFTCPVAGIYLVYAAIQVGGLTGNTNVAPNMGVSRSGGNITGTYHFVLTSTGYQKMECTAYVKCAANDTLSISLYTGAAQTAGATEFNGDTRNALCIAYIG